jgi:hypothetical protein
MRMRCPPEKRALREEVVEGIELSPKVARMWSYRRILVTA